MFTVGLTGGIGSGKTLVAAIFRHLGIPVFDADTESKKILDQDPDVRERLTRWFGSDIYVAGKPDRAKLAGIIFNDPVNLVKMNSLIHPKVKDQFIHWCSENQDKPYVIHEAAILFETGFYKEMRASVLVTAPEEIRIARVIRRDRTTGELIRQRMKNQWTDEQKAKLASYSILNDGLAPLLPAILEIHKKLIVLN